MHAVSTFSMSSEYQVRPLRSASARLKSKVEVPGALLTNACHFAHRTALSEP